jgi:hypothetical protein
MSATPAEVPGAQPEAAAAAPNPAPFTPQQQQQQTIVQVRDRLFHALFYRISIMYARKFTKTFRRLIEFFVLMLAIGSFALLSYLHVVFNRHPVNCLAPIQDRWPRDGVLRVEIVYNASQFFLMSYDEFVNRTGDVTPAYGLKGIRFLQLSFTAGLHLSIRASRCCFTKKHFESIIRG